MRRALAIAFVSLAFLSGTVTPSIARAESVANTPKLALHKAELWLAMAEPKPSTADLDAGIGAAAAVEERMTMLKTEMGAAASRRRTLQLQAAEARKQADALRAERDAPKGENGIKRTANSEARIADLEKKSETLLAQAEVLYQVMQRISTEETGLVDAIGRVRGVADMIGTSTLANAAQKTKAKTLAAKTTKSVQLHAAMIMTLMAATTADQ